MNSSGQEYSEPGSSPGLDALDHLPESAPPVISVFDFTPTELVETSPVTSGEIQKWVDSKNITWVHVQGQATVELLGSLSSAFGLHGLALEDVVSLGQRPKLESYEDECFVVMNVPALIESGVEVEQVSFFLGKTYVISFHQGKQDLFEPIRARLRNQQIGRIRTRGADYLFYALIDLVVDRSFPVLDELGDRIEDLEERILENPSSDFSPEIHQARRAIVNLRHRLAPQRDLLNGLIRDDHPVIRKKTKIYLRDCHDHMIRILETLESYRELVMGVQEIYMSALNHQMNDVMKVLTIIATIFIPLSFVTGLYGMNFDTSASPWNMPELHAYYGYPIVVAILMIVVVGMLLYFRKQRWL